MMSDSTGTKERCKSGMNGCKNVGTNISVLDITSPEIQFEPNMLPVCRHSKTHDYIKRITVLQTRKLYMAGVVDKGYYLGFLRQREWRKYAERNSESWHLLVSGHRSTSSSHCSSGSASGRRKTSNRDVRPTQGKRRIIS